GEGTGATVVAAATLLTDRIATRSVALGPRRYAKLSDFPLPLPEYRDEDAVTDRRLTVVTAGDGQSWWADELAAQASVGLDNELLDPTDDPWEIEMQAENLVRRSLDLGSRPAPSPEGRKYLVVDEDDSPRKRHWARLLALRALTENDLPVAVVDAAPTDGTAEEITTELKPEMFRATGSLPPCPGPFGGTTVVVLPRGSSAELEQRWLEVQEDDPLTKKSRFHRMRVATTDPGERGLITVLSTLKEEGRRNILLVPAEFAADAGTVQSLQRRVRSLEDEMTFQWLPGLGGREVLTPGSATAEAEDPIHHRLTVELQPSRNRLTVTDTIQLPESLRRDGLELSLSPDLRIRSSRPRLTRVGTTDDGSLVRYAVKTMPADGVLTLSANGTINDALGDLSEEYSRGFRSTRGIVGSQGVYLDGGSGWIPRFGDQLIDFEMEVSIPADWHVISQGAGTSNDGQGLARWTSELSVEQVYLVGGPLVVARDRAGDTEVLTYLHERDDALSRKYLDTAARYLEMYRRLIGPHPYSKFALVENFWETGFGMPSFTLLGPQVIRMPFILHSSFPHEILHDWWGNSVYVESKEGNWCEGLTAYMADHLVQEQRERGADYRRNTLQKYRNYVRESRDFPLTEFRSRHSAATEAVGYGKALMTFHQLRRKVGDDAFRAALAAFYREQLGQRASWADIEAAFEDQVDEELGPFFAQWIERTGAPELALTKMRSRRDGSRHRLTGRLDQVQAEAPYDLDVPLRVLTQDGAETHVVSTSSSSREFDLVLDAAPLSVAADPSFDLFRRLDPRETPASIGQLFGEPSILAVVPGSDPAERALHEQLVASWQSDAHSIEVVADTELDALPRDRSLWLLGHSNRFLSELLAHGESLGLSADRRAGRVTLAGETVDREDHSVVAILRHPSNLERAVGWIALGPDAAAPGLARKLPHYGKYSYLAFQGDEPTNVVKGQWPVHDSPLVVHLGDQPRLVPTEKRQALAELPPVFSERKLMSHVEWLAAPEREGRGLGTAGGAAAAEYVARAMAEIGLQPGGDDGTWFQSFTVSDGPGGRPVTARNVVGVLPGSKDSWGEQSVVLGAHHDHLGRGWPDVHSGDEGRIHPGADDNASGVAVLLELARVLVSEGGGSRNLVVVAFGAEESGRHGSRHYVKNPTLPLDQVHSMINLDAVGRLFGGKLSVHGTGTADEWPHVFRGCGYVTGVEPKIVPGGAEGSDQASFIDEGIPAVQVFTGVHADYHRPSDTADGIDGAGLVSVAAFVKEAVGFLLERATPMASRIEGAMAAPTTRPASAGSRRVSFGTVPDFGWEGQGVRIESLVAGGPAEAAGLAAGDVLLSIAGEPLTDLRGFSGLLKKLKPGQAVETVLLRNGERLVKTVEVRAR
ncbi:MAG: M20/M25/M40 family metallo-hydrolase, partial [Acidobacteriota bacterium]